MTPKKFILVTVLTMAICIMSLGYAALQERIDITGTTTVDSVYRVEITKVERSSLVGSATEKDIPNYTNLNANFNVGLTASTDSITYNIEISNLGTVDVKLNNTIISTEGSSKIKVLKTGIINGDILLAGESKTMKVEIQYNGEVETSEINGKININLEYTRLKGGTGEVVKENYYAIGDVVTFAGSNWYVIAESSDAQDYVTVLKEKILTKEELGEYVLTKQNTCTEDQVASNTYGCTTVGEVVSYTPTDTMQYYLSDTCHVKDTYGYTTTSVTGCRQHYDYEGSTVRKFLEENYINTLGEDNLKEIDGYKIRLITWDELLGDLGYTMDITNKNDGIKPTYNSNVPTWVYQDYGAKIGYWTMTPYETSTKNNVWYVYATGFLNYGVVYTSSVGVRPVINLLKTSIQ